MDESNIGSSVRTAGRGIDWLKLRDFLTPATSAAPTFHGLSFAYRQYSGVRDADCRSLRDAIDRGTKQDLSGCLFLRLLLDNDSGKLHDMRRCIFSVLTECRFEDQFSCGDF